MDLRRHQIDRILHLQAVINSNLGIDSTKKEKQEAKVKIKKLDRFIKRIDPDFFRQINIYD